MFSVPAFGGLYERTHVHTYKILARVNQKKLLFIQNISLHLHFKENVEKMMW